MKQKMKKNRNVEEDLPRKNFDQIKNETKVRDQKKQSRKAKYDAYEPTQ
jgi:hypothetical protein